MMGDKIQAKKIAKENGLPVIEGSEGGVKDIKEAKNLCKKIGFPILIKASGGGGGTLAQWNETPTLLFTHKTVQSSSIMQAVNFSKTSDINL